MRHKCRQQYLLYHEYEGTADRHNNRTRLRDHFSLSQSKMIKKQIVAIKKLPLSTVPPTAPSGVPHRVRDARLHDGLDIHVHLEELRERYEKILWSYPPRGHHQEPGAAHGKPANTHDQGDNKRMLIVPVHYSTGLVRRWSFQDKSYRSTLME